MSSKFLSFYHADVARNESDEFPVLGAERKINAEEASKAKQPADASAGKNG
jgi:hypothetical protein